jgi:MOSC domain-containing protein YiiM
MTLIHSIFIGKPQTHHDERGEWTSSIFRSAWHAPIELGMRGLAGDQVTDTKYHGSPDQAVCCHDLSHYDYWNEAYQLTGSARLGAGSLGENWTLTNGLEPAMCIGDIFAVGTARVQVSLPRYPCGKQERKLQLPGLAERSKETMRTGFYLRVLQAGMVQPGDAWVLLNRPQPKFSLELANQAVLKVCDAAQVQQLLALPELGEMWKKTIREKYS